MSAASVKSGAQLLWRGGFTQVYFSPWFLGPISLLAANILACVVHGLPQAVKRAWQPLTVETALTLPERGQITWPAGVDPQPRIAATLSRELGRCRQETLPDQKVYFLERGRFRPVGPYLIHVALLLILAGGLIGKFWGVDGQLAIDQGEVAGAFQVGPRVEKPLNFQVRLDKFQVSYYEPGGSPKEFRSDLTFMKDGREVSRATCRVNEPVTFGGLTFYQSSYGSPSHRPHSPQGATGGPQRVHRGALAPAGGLARRPGPDHTHEGGRQLPGLRAGGAPGL